MTKEKSFITLTPGEGAVVATGGVKIANNIGTVESGHLVPSAVDNVDAVVDVPSGVNVIKLFSFVTDDKT